MRHDLVEGLIATFFLHATFVCCVVLWALNMIEIREWFYIMLGCLAVTASCMVHDKHGEHFTDRTTKKD